MAAIPDRDFGEQLTGSTDKRLADSIFIRAGRFADEHQLRARIAHAENDLRTSKRVELAAGAVTEIRADRGTRIGRRARDLDEGRIPAVGDGAGPPRRIAADAVHAELGEEFQMGGQFLA